jgi:hypothetical protein
LLQAGAVDASSVVVFRDGVPIADCTDPSTVVAAPDPCVFRRLDLSGNDAEIDVYSSHASHWNFGKRDPLAIATSSLPDGTVGVRYQALFTASSGTAPYSWSIVSGALPDGLTLKRTTGAITGTPTAAGLTAFTVRVADAEGARATASLSITVAPTANPALARVGVAYWHAVASFSGVAPYHWSLVSGHLPGGLALNPETGVISGTPGAEGKFTASVRVTDSRTPTPRRVATKVTISVAPAAITIGPRHLARAKTSVAYGTTLSATGGTAAYKFTVASGALPPGITLTRAGVLSGTPTAPGTYAFTVIATDKFAFTGSRHYSLTVT